MENEKNYTLQRGKVIEGHWCPDRLLSNGHIWQPPKSCVCVRARVCVLRKNHLQLIWFYLCFSFCFCSLKYSDQRQYPLAADIKRSLCRSVFQTKRKMRHFFWHTGCVCVCVCEDEEWCAHEKILNLIGQFFLQFGRSLHTHIFMRSCPLVCAPVFWLLLPETCSVLRLE